MMMRLGGFGQEHSPAATEGAGAAALEQTRRLAVGEMDTWYEIVREKARLRRGDELQERPFSGHVLAFVSGLLNVLLVYGILQLAFSRILLRAAL
jgi:hypothetical protein